MALSAGTRLGPYEILALLGAGGMGEVYKARDTRIDRTVAIKILSSSVSGEPEFRARFEREARVVSQFDHPHICSLHDVGTHEGMAYLVMPHLEGETLAQRLERGALPFDEAVRYGAELAAALARAHASGVVHRDVKPGNIMLTSSGVRLMDFGLAKNSAAGALPSIASAPPTKPETLTTRGSILGTFQYMAPEQIEGSDADPRTDIWALGCVLYEMLTGSRPFKGASHAGLIGAILKDEPPPISSRQSVIPPALDHLVRRCLEKKPADRWQDAADIAGELRWIAAAPRSVGSDRSSKRRLRFWQVAAGLLIVVIATIIAVRTLGGSQASSAPALTLSIAPPDGTTFATTRAVVGLPWFAISPDGNTLAFVAMSADGREQLWLRPLGSANAHPVAGTDGARSPFWSADSRYLAFSANRKLQFIDTAAASPPQVLAGAQGIGFGGAWNPPNLIIGGPQGLRRLAPGGAGGGTQLTRVDTARGEFAHVWPQFLPDGRHVLFTATRPGEPGENQVWLVDLDGGKRSLVTTTTSSARHVPPGWLLYTTAGGLMAQRLDSALLRTTGTPIPIAERVGANGPSGYAAVSVSNTGVLVYGEAPDTDTRITWRDRTGRLVQPLDLPHSDAPAISRDGRTLAMERSLPQTGRSIWTYDVQRKMAQRAIFDHSLAPVWSPDGTSIAFTARRNGHLDQLFRKATTGSGEDLLVDSPGSFATDWTLDGRFIIFQGPSADTDTRVLTVADGTSKTLLSSPGGAIYATVSPDGRWLAYSSAKSGAMEVYVRPFPAGDQEWLVSHGGAEPEWRADGRELFYIAADRHLVSVPIASGNTFDPGEPQLLFEMNVEGLSVPFGTRRYAPMPDGQSFFISELTSRAAPLPLTVVVNWTALLKDQR
jgi:serine/threonine protein kinase/Tol biopolymer transport system component